MGKSEAGRSREDKVFDAVCFAVLTFILLIVAYPLYFVIISSFSDPVRVSQGSVIFYPMGFTMEGYQKVFDTGSVMRGFFNSLWYSVMGVAINLAVTLPTAYALSRSDFCGKKFVTVFYLITMFVGGGLIPTYLVVKNTGLLDSVWALVLPGALGVYNVMVARTFFMSNIPGELLDAARIDGCSDTRFFFSIVLPISGAIIAILVLWCGVGHWNSYFSALLYISTREKQPLQMELRYILLQNTQAVDQVSMSVDVMKERERAEALKEMMKYSLIIVANIPVMILYPFIQKHFVRGVTVGSLKG
ncbi:MAG: carbohydrate ABC transporter permease [Treponema sp.]|jgi:putative aldouronate transport system permease protein|nr:carbohydrate ABC transporter permease [Treponema sp.]